MASLSIDIIPNPECPLWEFVMVEKSYVKEGLEFKDYVKLGFRVQYFEGRAVDESLIEELPLVSKDYYNNHVSDHPPKP